MYEYSLTTVPNRLAKRGEYLITHRFMGSLGLASLCDLERATKAKNPPTPVGGFWCKVWAFLSPLRPEPISAVYIPYGTKLLLQGIPYRLQNEFGVGPEKEVIFVQLPLPDMGDSDRDAVRFPDGREVKFQDLWEGMGVRVVDLLIDAEDSGIDLQHELMAAHVS